MKLMQATTATLALLFTADVFANQNLRVLTWEGYAPDDKVAAFEKMMSDELGESVTLDVKYVSSSDEYFNSIRRGTVDVIAPSHNVIKDERYGLIKNGLITPINLNNIPNYEKLIPSLQRAEFGTDGGNVYFVPLVHGPYGLAYNSSVMNTEPTSWNDLWANENKGKYTISSDYFEVNIYITALALGYDKNEISDVSKLSSPEFLSKLSSLVKNSGSMWSGVDTVDDMKDNLLGAAWGFSFNGLNKIGQDWKMANPKEGTTSWVDGYALSKDLKNNEKLKSIAEKWINYSLSDDFQVDVIVRGISSSPVNIMIKDRLSIEEVKSLHIDDPNYFSENRILWPTLSLRQRNFIKNLWMKASK